MLLKCRADDEGQSRNGGHKSCRGQNCGVQARIETEDHAMSLIRNRRGFLGALFSALLALALFDPGAATAQQVKQIKLTEKHIQGLHGRLR
jgi:hypothetical protein